MRVGVVGDLHAPFIHPLYKDFCSDTFDAWKVDRVHFVGDIVDAHALSFWEHDPNGLSAECEAEHAARDVADWYRTFPRATVCIGNHDARHFRKAKKAGIPDRYIRGYAHVWGTPRWKWEVEHEIDGVLYEHGTGTSGKDAAYNRAIEKRQSLVMGHVHAYAGVKWHTNGSSRVFGLLAGCGIDCRGYAFEYGQSFARRPVLGCGVVIDGTYAYFEPMPCGVGEPYHRGRA